LQRSNAATISVNTFNDVVAVDGACSLREAVTSVNKSAASGNRSGECAAGDGNNDTIVLTTGTYHLTITRANEDFNTTGDLDLRASMTIAGAGMDSTVIDASGLSSSGGSDRAVQIVGPSIQVTLQDLMIGGGRAPDAASTGTPGAPGGGILVSNATLALQRVELFDNVAGNGGDAPAGMFSFGGAGGAGGGLAADASAVTISDSLLTFNHGGYGGNASAGPFIASPGTGGAGGAISLSNSSTLTLQRSTLAANASGLGGLLFGASTNSGYGGALYLDGNSAATVMQSDIDGNASGDSSVGIAGGGIAVIGGAILTLTQSSVTRNVSRFGGGIYASSAAALQLSNDTFAANQASLGGAMYLDNTAANIDFGTISNNTAATGSGIAVDSNNLVQLRNSIVSGNTGGNDCGTDGGTQNYASAGYNIAGSACPSNGTADIAATDPQLGLLGANGGLGDTMMPHPTSPSTDAGSCVASSLNVDERTHARPSDVPRVANVADGCDIGAVELDDDIFWDGFED
jgi:CSLREA domain-containing protein